MNVPDALRYVILAGTGFAVGVMVATNVVAFFVLRPPKRLGFLWVHVTFISLAVCGLLAVSVARVLDRLGDTDTTWYTWVTLASVLALDLSMFLVFRIERTRMAEKVAVREIS